MLVDSGLACVDLASLRRVSMVSSFPRAASTKVGVCAIASFTYSRASGKECVNKRDDLGPAMLSLWVSPMKSKCSATVWA